MKRTFRQRLRAFGRYIPGWSRALRAWSRLTGAARPCIRAARLYIPGFRHPSQTSIAVAITYYAAALAVAAASWPWGIALLAAPFFIFALADLSQSHSRRIMITAGIAAAILLLGVALGLSQEGYRLKQTPAHPALAQSIDTPRAVASKPTLVPVAATPSDPQASLYIASKSGKVFHRPDCASARNIKPENRVQYATRAAAIAAGLNPCKKCKP